MSGKLTEEQCFAKAREIAARSLPKIVRAIAQKAMEGSYQHAKFLMEIAKRDEGELEGDEVRKLVEELEGL